MFDEEDLRSIREGRAEWEEETHQPTLDRFGERKDEFTTDTGGHEVDSLYTPNDVADLDYASDIGFPGEEPYTRGVYPPTLAERLFTTWSAMSCCRWAGVDRVAVTDVSLLPYGLLLLATSYSVISFGLDVDSAASTTSNGVKTTKNP